MSTLTNQLRLLRMVVLVAVTLFPSLDTAYGQTREDAGELKLHAGALAELIDEVGGRDVVLPRARVIALLNPRAFLVESASSFSTPPRHFDRVLVLVRAGELRVTAASLIGRTVAVRGVARTLLGLEVTREVPWPAELTRHVLDRYEIRAGVLAASVRTADGVDLIGAP
jgi:hypothetical protein